VSGEFFDAGTSKKAHLQCSVAKERSRRGVS
jgi:hypothetical protein